MISKLISAASVLLAINSALASSVYVGASIGISATQINKQLVYPLYSSLLTTHQSNSSYDAFHGQLSVGKKFDTSLIDFTIQGDFDGFTNSAKDTLTNYFLTTPAYTLECLNYGFGLFILPQLQLNDRVDVFAGPGVVRGHFITNSSYTGGTLGVTGSHKDWLTGFGLKLGMLSQISAHWNLVLSYQYNQYERITQTALEPLSVQVLQAQYKPSINMFSIGTRYLFDGELLSSIK